MKKKMLLQSSLLVLFAVWGYAVGMLDYRLMVNTADTCTCWIKFASLMGVTTLIVAIGLSYFIIKKTTLCARKDEDLPQKGSIEDDEGSDS
ncbi:MAG: hypothetical protein M1300_08795 [Epsilonproteobacteria bacterium]|nr:hypothetical protein [Campylobacterota bacterium]